MIEWEELPNEHSWEPPGYKAKYGDLDLSVIQPIMCEFLSVCVSRYDPATNTREFLLSEKCWRETWEECLKMAEDFAIAQG